MAEKELLAWLLGIGGTLFCAMLVYILNNIGKSIEGIRSEVSNLNNNLVRIDRRVAYLEGKIGNHTDDVVRRSRM